MQRQQKEYLSDRFINEKIAPHWNITPDKDSFKCLLHHIENITNFRKFFEVAFDTFLSQHEGNELVLADIGGGAGWTSALMALNPRVKKVYLIEPSDNRRSSNVHICNHFKVPEKKVERINGTFQNFNLVEKVDAVILCASIHHCFDQFIPILFENISHTLKNPNKKSSVLIANEHYVKFPWLLRRLGYYFKNYFRKEEKKVFYNLTKLRMPHPFDGEHWRTKKELINIFEKYNYSHQIIDNEGDLCIKSPPYLFKYEWGYYFAILGQKITINE